MLTHFHVSLSDLACATSLVLPSSLIMSSHLDKTLTNTLAPIAADQASRSSLSSFGQEKDGHRQHSDTMDNHTDPGDARDGAELERVETAGYAHGFRLTSIVIAICLSMFLVALDMTIVSTAIPRITDQFHSLQDVGWYGSAFFLTVAAFQSTWGKAYKYFDLKYVFLTSIAIFELGSLICGVAPTSTALIVGRAIAGWGGAGIAAGCYSIIAFSVPPKQAPAFTGILGAVYSVASVIGPLLGGVFTDKATWRWCFYVNLPVGAVSVAIIIPMFQTPKQAKPVQASLREKILQLDLSGSAILLCSVVCLILALQWGGTTKPWNSADVIGTLVGFGVLLIAFAINEQILGERALFVRRIMKQKTLIVMSAFICFVGGAFFLWLYYLPIYFQSIKGTSASQSGIRNLPLILSVGLFSIVSGGTITATGHYVPVMILGSIFTAVGAGMIYTFEIGTSPAHWIGYQIIAGIGIGLTLQIPIIVAQGTSKPADLAQVTAIILFFQTIVGSVWVSVAQALFTNRLITAAATDVPGISGGTLIATGATELRNTFTAEQLPGVLKAYMAGLTDSYTLAIPLASIAALVAIAALIFDHRVLNQEQKKDIEDGEVEKVKEERENGDRGGQ